MQDMTPQMCQNTRTPSADETTTVPTTQLKDIRDGKKYWVAKLADGHCWMTQNLALNLDTSKTLTPYGTDISANWTPTNNTTNVANTGDTDAASIQSWNFGDYIINSPNAGIDLCSSYVANLQSCSGFSSLTDVGSGTGYTDDYEAIGSDANIVAVDTVNKKYDAHYLLGNYYIWNAATASTGGTIMDGNATSSICPKGWRLPTSDSTADGSFGYLMDAYGLPSTNSSATATQINKLGSAPLYFHRAGDVDPDSSYGLRNVGDSVGYWSSTAYPNMNIAYGFGSNNGYLGPSSYGNRYYGLSVRCMI